MYTLVQLVQLLVNIMYLSRQGHDRSVITITQNMKSKYCKHVRLVLATCKLVQDKCKVCTAIYRTYTHDGLCYTPEREHNSHAVMLYSYTVRSRTCSYTARLPAHTNFAYTFLLLTVRFIT